MFVQDFRGQKGKDTKFEVYNPDFAPDQFGMALSYFNGDYISQDEFGQQSVFNSNNPDGLAMQPLRQLYNGNISAWTTQTNRKEATTNQYTYDRLHRITSSTFWKSYGFGDGYFQHYETSFHQTSYSYDANGNIKNLQRTDNIGEKLDYLSYGYADENISLNKLKQVKDEIQDNVYKKDLKGEKNYTYDAIGNIISQENIKSGGNFDNSTIEWNAYGKVAKVTRNVSESMGIKPKNTEIIYLYDPMGNRILKKLLDVDTQKTTKTFYTRDAQGNVLSIYENGKQTEIPIYGSDRIGTYSPPQDTIINPTIFELKRGYKRYELKDHLGNVRVTVSDSKRVAFVSETLVFSADIKTYTDYYAFGMEMVGRNWTEGEAYRFGHNGQEKSKEVGEGNYTAEFWEYDSQTTRRFNLDPKPNPAISDYATFALNPIWFSDMKGDTTRVFGLDGKYLGILVTGSVNEAHFIEESLYKDIKNGHFPNSRDTKKPHKAQEDCVRAYSVAYLGKNSMADIIKMKNGKHNYNTYGYEIEACFYAYLYGKEIRFQEVYTEGATSNSVSPQKLIEHLESRMLKAAREKLCISPIFGWGHLHPSGEIGQGNIGKLLNYGTPSDPEGMIEAGFDGNADYDCMVPNIVEFYNYPDTKKYHKADGYKQTPAFIGTRYGITVYGTCKPTDKRTETNGIEPVKSEKASYIPNSFFK